MRHCVAPKSLLRISLFCFLTFSAHAALAQVMNAVDDFHGLQLGQTLVVDAPGILDNDLFDDEAAAEMGGSAALVTDVTHGTLTLTADGAFSYWPDETFTGHDSFVYAAENGNVSDLATVFLTACNGGPDVFVCWEEGAFISLANELGYHATTESFEGPAWGGARSPNTTTGATNLGVHWTSNYTGTPVFNPLTTSSGAAHTGQWGVYDANHGYAEGTAAACDVDLPGEPCLYHDGFTGEVIAGLPPLVGVGGYISGDWSANVAIVLDDSTLYDGGHVPNVQFLGIIDKRPSGFTRFSFEEQSGKIGQGSYIWGDDFTFLTTAPKAAAAPQGESHVYFAGAGPNPTSSSTTWRFLLPVAAGAYFGRLRVGPSGSGTVQVRKLVILH